MLKLLILTALVLVPSAQAIAMARKVAGAGVEQTMPSVGGIVAPPGTTIANMDVAVRAKENSVVYELKSPLSMLDFKDRYAANAIKAGYRVSVGKDLVVGVRQDGTSIRLRVFTSVTGSTGLLTVIKAASRKL